VDDGYRESVANWREVLDGLDQRGLKQGPKLAVGAGVVGFRTALGKPYQDTAQQRCWLHKTPHVIKVLPNSVLPKVKADLHVI
jgi:transposase-like protein